MLIIEGFVFGGDLINSFVDWELILCVLSKTKLIPIYFIYRHITFLFIYAFIIHFRNIFLVLL